MKPKMQRQSAIWDNVRDILIYRILSNDLQFENAIDIAIEDPGLDQMKPDFPHKWERHGDLILVGSQFFTLEFWSNLDGNTWTLVCQQFHPEARRLAKRVGPIQTDFRTPFIKFLYNASGSTVVEKTENHIKYRWDIEKCMFSSGNISEKERIAKLDCTGKTVVDMYTGIGYFTLTYLVHAKAKLVYALEWNLDAAKSLLENLALNKVSEQCFVILGDNTKTCPVNVADHVNLGLIPSSENAWKAACYALKQDEGGFLHIHGNVDAMKFQLSSAASAEQDPKTKKQAHLKTWACQLTSSIEAILNEIDVRNIKWFCKQEQCSIVKSYGPNVDHCVVTLECRPIPIISQLEYDE